MPLLHAVVRTTAASRGRPFPSSRLFALGLTCGFAYFAGTVYWTSSVMAVYGGLPRWQATPVAGLLVAFLALYPALFTVTVGWLIARIGSGALVLAPFVWVATELARGTLFSGFPWVLLGYSQARELAIVQAASIGGVYLLSLLVAQVSAALAYALAPRPHRVAVLAGTLALVAVVGVWGARRVGEGSLVTGGTAVTVGIVQGNVPQDQKWHEEYREQIFQRYLRLTRQVTTQGATLVIWPESATPFLYEEEPAARDAIQRVLAEHDAYLLLGSDQLERGPSPRFFNAAFLLAPDGRTLGVYRKNRLVPFGEYVPMRDLLFFAAPLVESVGEFAPGDDVSPLAFPQGRLSVAICYEVVFPALARRSVQLGSRLLTTVTNDAWYGDSSAPYQHFEQATLRAVENGRYLVRAANTGISAIVDPYGRVQARSALFETVGFTGHIRLLDGQTVYGKIGDVVAHASLALVLLALIATFRPPTFRAGARR